MTQPNMFRAIGRAAVATAVGFVLAATAGPAHAQKVIDDYEASPAPAAKAELSAASRNYSPLGQVFRAIRLRDGSSG